MPTADRSFKDHFSGHAPDYARYRPIYPVRLFETLAAVAPRHDLAWDCATGSGQAAVGLAEHFARVVATDGSPEQIAHARPHPRIEYRVALAEDSRLPAAAVDLVLVAQALHWLDHTRFYTEARRVLCPGGVLAATMYDRLTFDGSLGRLVERLHDEVKSHWPPERRHTTPEGFRALPFPAPELDLPPVVLEQRWTLEQLLGYLGTWSAVRRYRAATGRDPIAALAGEFAAAWGDPAAPHRVTWEMVVRAARISPSTTLPQAMR